MGPLAGWGLPGLVRPNSPPMPSAPGPLHIPAGELRPLLPLGWWAACSGTWVVIKAEPCDHIWSVSWRPGRDCHGEAGDRHHQASSPWCFNGHPSQMPATTSLPVSRSSGPAATPEVPKELQTLCRPGFLRGRLEGLSGCFQHVAVPH